MKKTIFLLALVFAFASCKDENKLWDPNAMINLRQGTLTKADTNPNHLSALEIVKQTTNLKCYNVPIFGDQAVGRGFSDAQRDYQTPMLKMFGTDIIDMFGKYDPSFIEATDCVLQRVVNAGKPNEVIDTIAYIPNAVLRAAELKIKAAFAKEDYETCYAIFNDAFTFLPITGTEWRALKAKNEQ